MRSALLSCGCLPLRNLVALCVHALSSLCCALGERVRGTKRAAASSVSEDHVPKEVCLEREASVPTRRVQSAMAYSPYSACRTPTPLLPARVARAPSFVERARAEVVAAGRWRVVDVLLQQRESVVFRVESTKLNGEATRGALKVLVLEDSQTASTKLAEQRAERAFLGIALAVQAEMRAQKKDLGGSQHIVQLLDAYPTELGRGLHMVTELANCDLFTACMDPHVLFQDERPRLGEALSGALMRQVLLGVDFTHTLGFAHLDLKLDNMVLFIPSMTVKIIDFAFCTNRSPRAHRKCQGTPRYFAPEMYLMEKGVVQSINAFTADAWSLGVCLFALLYSCYPWINFSNHALLRYAYEPGVSVIDVLRSPQQDQPTRDEFDDASVATPLAIHLWSSLLCFSRSHRRSVRDALTHPWIAAHAADALPGRSSLARLSP